ncbi:hypothetical protein AB0C10_21970 [Microbispora amethystogenes]|uniref:hypothetical protein n=1 Tax=Microbispora amethystogenes TaxID=1427754 RepID=UPI003406D91C
MSGTVSWRSPHLIFRFPFDRSANEALQVATCGVARWDSEHRGFVISVNPRGLTGALLDAINRFIVEHELQITPEALKPLGRRPAGGSPAWVREANSSSHGLGQGRLRADLLPADTWGSNLRGILPRADWDRLRIPVCESVGNRCEVCKALCFMEGDRKRRPDCHELWIFESREGRDVQRLERLIALCPDCHRVQHIGWAQTRGEMPQVIAKLREVNRWTSNQATAEISRARRICEQRELVRWDLDLSALAGLISIDGFPDLYVPAADRRRLGNSSYGED